MPKEEVQHPIFNVAVSNNYFSMRSGPVYVDSAANKMYVLDQHGNGREEMQPPMISLSPSLQLKEMMEWYLTKKHEDELAKSHPVLQKMQEEYQLMKALCVSESA